ncbi:hypothetical protein NE237_028824 [Protea cynaroides]|uniref:Bifunctional inhibitor/plant lipid transfer protein/seed storage helical domain-containing protein n=1 Tax=Protea cynaroides TaxID=273540 RepID=A0A9Q0JUH9_9MAGN|nr:hypothetical protein NE237_028824 [Protea cynaroides]
MASKASAAIALFLSLNLLFFTLVSACGTCSSPPKPKPKPKPKPCPNPTPAAPTCPKDTLKLGACVDLLTGVLGVVLGTPSDTKCCKLLKGLVDLDAAVCLCTAIKANVLGINLDIPVSLSLILNTCGKTLPSGFKCA